VVATGACVLICRRRPVRAPPAPTRNRVATEGPRQGRAPAVRARAPVGGLGHTAKRKRPTAAPRRWWPVTRTPTSRPHFSVGSSLSAFLAHREPPGFAFKICARQLWGGKPTGPEIARGGFESQHYGRGHLVCQLEFRSLELQHRE
jgi:hypothetical protein